MSQNWNAWGRGAWGSTDAWGGSWGVLATPVFIVREVTISRSAARSVNLSRSASKAADLSRSVTRVVEVGG